MRFSERKVLLGRGVCTGASSRDGATEYYIAENGAIYVGRIADGDKMTDGKLSLLSYADAYARGSVAVEARRGTVSIAEETV